MTSSQDWKKAVIHLESAGDLKFFEERNAEWHELGEEARSGEISASDWSDRISKIAKEGRAMRFQGTALFLEHESHRYLITARHVLDEIIARCLNRGADPIPGQLAEKRIFPIIFRVPTLDELITMPLDYVQPFLMNLGAGTTWMQPYTFLDYPQSDLAIISLDAARPDLAVFATELINWGYAPISSSDILDGPSMEEADVYTIGFPRNISIILERKLPPEIESWSSSDVSLPAYSFGKVSMLHPNLPYFWVDMSIFPGNSGGPVIENDKLVGIISAQPVVIVDDKPDIQVRAPFAKVYKSKFINDLLAEQIEKDKVAQSRRGGRKPGR
jgi:hypothetical protein